MHHSAVSVEQRHLWTALRQWMIALLVCGLLFGLDRVGGLGWFRGGVERGLILIDERMLAVEGWFTGPIDWVMSGREKSQRVADLEERLAQAAVEQQKLKDLTAQVELLQPLAVKTTAGRKASQIGQLIHYGDRVMLALGEGSGVAIGQMMTDKEGVLVGQVGQVGHYMSEVKLLDQIETRVQVQSVSGATKGIVEGKGGRAELVGVLQTELLSVGDVLVTSGADGIYPPGLVVGQVTELQGKPEDVTKGGVVELLGEKNGWVALW